jgi:hypothetical protein
MEEMKTPRVCVYVKQSSDGEVEYASSMLVRACIWSQVVHTAQLVTIVGWFNLVDKLLITAFNDSRIAANEKRGLGSLGIFLITFFTLHTSR